MTPRKKKPTVIENGDCGIRQSLSGTSFRQMTITESFKYSKPRPFKLDRPTIVSGVVIEISDGDTDEESVPITNLKGPTMEMKREPGILDSVGDYDASSPSKRPRATTGSKPYTSTPTASSNNSMGPTTPDISRVGSLNNSTAISPASTESNSSSKTITYEYPACNASAFLSQPSGITLTGQTNPEEQFIMNYVETDDELAEYVDIESGSKATNKSNVTRRLNFNNTTGDNSKSVTEKKSNISKEGDENCNVTSGRIEKLPKKKEAKRTSHIMLDRNSNSTTTTSGSLPKKGRKRRINIDMDNDKHMTVKENTLSKENFKKATLARNKGSPKDYDGKRNLNGHGTSKNVEPPAMKTSPSVLRPTVVQQSTQQKDMSKRKLANDHQPCCSKSLANDKSKQAEQDKSSACSTEKVISADKAKNTSNNSNKTTSEKQKMGQNTPTKNGNARRELANSPNKTSPPKTREIKSLKSKEGRVLHVKQMDELVKLFLITASNRHLKSLLNRNEREILAKFIEMEENKRYVIMKLFMWKKLWYNIYQFCNKAQLQVEDDKDIDDIFHYLMEEKFVDTNYTQAANLSELLKILGEQKVREIMVERRIKPIKTKQENIKTILEVANKQVTLTSESFKDLIMKTIEKKMGFAIKIKEEIYDALYNAYTLATFTNPTFYKVEDYFRYMIHLRIVFPETLIEEYVVFYSREKFLNYGKAVRLIAELDEQLTDKNKDTKYLGLYSIGAEAYRELLKLDMEDLDDHSKAPHLKRFTAQHVYTKVLSSCCEKLYTKQNGCPNNVKRWLEYMIKKFPTSRRLGQWYQILIRLYMSHLDEINYETGACRLIDAYLSNQLGEIAKYDLGELGCRLKVSKRHKMDQIYHDRIAAVAPRPIKVEEIPHNQIDSRCIRSDISGRKRAYISKSNEGISVRGVEQVALEHYAENGYPGGEHCEGSLVCALLMLFFWDIIYNPIKPIPGTFISKLQVAPLDMFTSYFYSNRKEAFDKRLEEIGTEWSEEKLIDFAVDNWRNHSHERGAFGMIMDTINDELSVEVLITVISGKVLAKIFERLIKDMRQFRSGMPDLLVWNVDERKCKFVEVKGENDRLSTGQKLWLRYLKQCGTQAEVCWVHSTGSKRKRINKNISTDGPEDEDEQPGPSNIPAD